MIICQCSAGLVAPSDQKRINYEVEAQLKLFILNGHWLVVVDLKSFHHYGFERLIRIASFHAGT